MKNEKIGQRRKKLSKKKGTRIKFLKSVRNKKIIKNIVYIFLVLCILYNVIFLINTTIKKTEYFNLFGISLFSMETNLMEPEIPKNSLIITKQYGENNIIGVNDKIAYSVNGKIRINEVMGVESADGKIIYHTKSNQNYYIDSEGVSKNQIIGKVITIIPNLGIGLEILQSKITTLCIIIFLVIIYMYNKKVYKSKMRRKVHLYNKRNKKETFED